MGRGTGAGEGLQLFGSIHRASTRCQTLTETLRKHGNNNKLPKVCALGRGYIREEAT